MKTLVWTICFVVALNGESLAQTVPPPSPKPPAKPISKSEGPEFTPQQRRALALLDSLVKDTIAFDDQPLRVKTQAKIADALWDFNQARAREIFTEAFQAIEAIEFPSEPSSRYRFDEDTRITYSKRFQLRQEVLRLAGTHDLELAARLRESTTEKSAEKKSENDLQKAKREQRLQAIMLAQSLAPCDPLRAAQIFRQVRAIPETLSFPHSVS